MRKVGFANSSYFSKAFKAEFGTTPKEFGKREDKEIN
jgi:AraC-like DNA-binding protein